MILNASAANGRVVGRAPLFDRPRLGIDALDRRDVEAATAG